MTLVFTDVQSSTALWDEEPDLMAVALSLHNEIFRTMISKYSGYEVKTEGDAFMVAFQDPLKAVRFCAAMQLELLTADWPPDLLKLSAATEQFTSTGELLYRGLRVRMGAHCGDPIATIDENSGLMDYFGPMVNRSARVGGSGHGGQIVISEGVYAAVQAQIIVPGSDLVVTPLGEHLLKGLKEPEKLYQVMPRALVEREFAEPSTVTTALKAHAHRDEEMAAKLRESGARAPYGSLALVFTDVQDSTVLWDEDAEAMANALGAHNDLMRMQILNMGGYEVKTEGDAFMVAFHTAAQAVKWCLTVQEALVNLQWPQEILTRPAAAVELGGDEVYLYIIYIPAIIFIQIICISIHGVCVCVCVCKKVFCFCLCVLGYELDTIRCILYIYAYR